MSCPASTPRPKPPRPPTYWTGPYVGANFGGAFSAGEHVLTPIGWGATDPSGVIGGLQFGYNYLFSPNWLLGIEGELEWTSAQGTENFTTAVALGAGQVISDHNWYDTVAGRLGYTMGPLAVLREGRRRLDERRLPHGREQGFNTGMSSINTTRTGVTIGGGAEYMLSPRWSAKVEYAYLDFGTRRYNFAVPVFGPSTVHTRVNEVKFGMNYHWMPGMITGGF